MSSSTNWAHRYLEGRTVTERDAVLGETLAQSDEVYRRELLGSTHLGQAVLAEEDKQARARGDVPKGTTMPDAARARLLGASSLGQAILDSEAKAAKQ